jgi:hypothetical protein
MPDFSTTVSLVAYDAARTEFRATTARPRHRSLVHQGLKHGGFVSLARGEEERHEFALPLSTEMDFGAETALTPA